MYSIKTPPVILTDCFLHFVDVNTDMQYNSAWAGSFWVKECVTLYFWVRVCVSPAEAEASSSNTHNTEKIKIEDGGRQTERKIAFDNIDAIIDQKSNQPKLGKVDIVYSLLQVSFLWCTKTD
jgi:hypothetical protein